MALHALEDIDDAFEATRAFLTPFDGGQWLRLALVAFFVGGAGGSYFGGNNFGGGGGGGGPPPGDVGVPTIPPRVWLAIAVVVVVAVLIGLLFAVVGAVMEFVLVESLREEAIHVRRYFRRYFGKGLRLFGFRLVLGLAALGIVVVVVGGAVLASGGIDAIDGAGDVIGLVLIGVPVVVVVGLLFGLVQGFTTVFVVPVMILEDRTVLGGWRRFWPTLRAEWAQFAAYVGVSFVLHLVAGAVVGIVVGILSLFLIVPLIFLGIFGLVATGGTFSIAALVVLAALALVAVLLLLSVGAFIQAPIVAFFRYYALLVLGDVDAEFDAIPERRAAIREGSESAA